MIEYNRNADFAIILIKDSSDNTIYKKRINLTNKQEYFEAMIGIAEKYGFKPEVEYGKDVNSKNKEKDIEKKFDWFGKI